jgi:cephalosporin-C deacetylase-like acetyl esterase
MEREDVEFKRGDCVTLRGWFYKPVTRKEERLPCLVLTSGFSATKDMSLTIFAEYFTSRLALNCLAFDNRGFGASDGVPRQEVSPTAQTSDISDAITYVQSRPDVDEDRIGIWGSSFSGGNVLWVGAVDRRVKAVVSQVPLIDGWQNYHWLVPVNSLQDIEDGFQAGLNHIPCKLCRT